MTGNDLIKSVLRITGATASGENPTADEASDTLNILNQMLDSWSADGLTIFTSVRSVFNLIALQQAYTLGLGGNFNIARPPHINSVGILNLNNPAQPLELPIDYFTDDQKWAAIPVKNVQSSLPDRVWDDTGFPLRTLSFYPIPNVQVQAAIYSWNPLASFPDLVTDINFPTGYLEAIKYNLAIRCSAEGLGKPSNPETIAMASSSLRRIKTRNIEIGTLKCDEALTPGRGKRYNWLSDR